MEEPRTVLAGGAQQDDSILVYSTLKVVLEPAHVTAKVAAVFAQFTAVVPNVLFVASDLPCVVLDFLKVPSRGFEVAVLDIALELVDVVPQLTLVVPQLLPIGTQLPAILFDFFDVAVDSPHVAVDLSCLGGRCERGACNDNRERESCEDGCR
jgi:hypothetical protein